MDSANRQRRGIITGKILVVDDDQDVRSTLSMFLEKSGHSVEDASSAEETLDALRRGAYDLIVMDVKMTGMSGIEAIPFIREIDSEVAIIMMTGYDSTDVAIEAIRRGAYDYFAKPFKYKDIETTIRRALVKRTLIDREDSKEIIGESDPVKRVKKLIAKVAPLESTILITGESGTGKELVADTIHSQSGRSNGPFIKINCAAIPESLLESELFGVEKGAFTGANIQRPGKFELANNGTILLDEIGDMPFSIQAKLLRVVEQKQIDKLGGSKPVSVDCRIIASTNQDLDEQIKNNNFRKDLYYRLNVVSIYLSPLREMLEDIPIFVPYFLDKIGLRMGICLEGVTDEALEILLSYDWPGNVRELANLLERAVIFRNGSIVGASEIRMAFHKFPGTVHSFPQGLCGQALSDGNSIHLTETLKQVEKTLILKALLRAKGVQTEAAKMLGLSPKNLWKKIQKYSIEPQAFVKA